MTLKTVLSLLLLVGFSFLIGFSYDYHLPKLESFLLVELEGFSTTHLPARIWAKKLHFHIMPLGIVLEDVKVLPKAPLDKYIAPAALREVGAKLAFWPLLRGEVRLSQVFVRDSELNIFLRNELFAKSKSSNALKFDFDRIYGLPIDEVELENVQLQGRLDPQNVVFRISNLDLLLENRYQSIFAEVTAPRVLVKPSGTAPPLNVQLELRTLIEAQELQVSAFKLKANDSFLVASGRFNGDFSTGQVDRGKLDARTKIQLPDLNIWEGIFSLHPKLPPIAGRAEVDLGLELNSGNKLKFEGELNTKSVDIDHFVIGQVQGHLSSDSKTIRAKQIKLENNAGQATIKNLEVSLNPQERKASLDLNVAKLDLHDLLEDLRVHGVPIVLPLKGDVHCDAEYDPAPQARCTGAVDSTKFVLSTKDSAKVIVAAHDMHVKGGATLDLKGVTFSGEATAGKGSTGRSTGTVIYDQGFKVNYQADKLLFSDVDNIANLKVEGTAKINGSTQGTAHTGTLDLNVDGKELWLEDFPLGAATAKVSYKDGNLAFSGVSGQYGVSRYNGNVNVDLHEKQIKVSGQVPFMDLKDVQNIFQRKVHLPFEISGTGTGKIEAHGPFEFRAMTYNFQSSFFRGQIAEENFDELTFKVHAKNGFVKSDKIRLTKASGAVEVNGQISPKGEIDTVAIGRNLRLEQSENVLDLGLDLQGLADFTVLLRGQLPHPRVELNGRLSRVVLADQAAADSVFKLNFLRDRTEGSGQFLGSKILANFILPYSSEAPFLLDIKTKQWDFTNVFSLVSRSARQIDFGTSLTMNMKVASPNGGFWNSSGEATVDEFLIHKGSKSMRNERPMSLEMNQGVINSKNFSITASDGYLKVDVAGLSRNNLNASLNGKMDLSLVGLFTPFISDLRGNLAISLDARGSVDQPHLTGSAMIEKGYAKFEDFIHPILNLRADVLFNDNQILVNSMGAEVAGGKANGEGKVTFKGHGLRPIEAHARFTDVKLNIPENYRSRGSGTVDLRGEKFPYTLDINYEVAGGNVTAEFAANNSSSQNTIKESAYLPHFVEKDSFHPFIFNLFADLKEPVSVSNSLLQGPVTGQMRVNGNPSHMLLTGTMTAQPGAKVLFRDQAFEVVSAYAEWNAQPPEDPKIYVAGNAHVTENVVDEQNRTTQNQYEISMLVQGHGQSPQFTLSSQPPLGQREIVSLLALGTTGSTTSAEERKTSVVEAANPSAAIGSAILGRAGGKQVKDALGVDVKMTSAPPLVINPNASPTATPKITLSKQWTPKLGASASSTIESNPNNTVQLEYKLNKSISAIGSWDGRETLHDQQQNTARNVLGLDLQYKVQFK